MASLEEYESLNGSVGGNEDQPGPRGAEPICFRSEVRPQGAHQVNSSHELERWESVQLGPETKCGTTGREVILVVDADGFVLPEDPTPGTDPRDYTDIRIGLHLETQGQKAALKKGDGSRPIYWVATHDAKGGISLMFRGVDPEAVDRGFVLRVTESSVHGAPPDTRLLQAIRREETRSGHKIETVDQSLLEAIASGQVVEMQRLLLEGKEDEAVKLGPPREKRRRETVSVEIKGEERDLALAVERSLQPPRQEPEPVQTSTEDEVEECAAAKRLRIAGADPTRAEDKCDVVGQVLDEESMTINIKKYMQETKESTGAIDQQDVKASDSTSGSSGGPTQCDDSDDHSSEDDEFSYQDSDASSYGHHEDEEEEELSTE